VSGYTHSTAVWKKYTITGSTGTSGAYLPLSGGTVTGGTIFQSGLTANTISATTYQNLPVSAVTSGTGISASTSNGTVTITNTSPDKTVTISGGTGITTGGTYPNFTLVNSAPDQTVTITGGTNIQIAGTYPNFGVNLSGGTTNYLPRWTGTTALGNSQIRDDGTNVGVGVTPSGSYKMYVYSLTNSTTLNVQNQTSGGIGISSLVNGGGGATGISSSAQGGNGYNNTGILGVAQDGLLAIGVQGTLDTSEFGGITTGIGGYFDARAIGGYSTPLNAYSVQLLDGTEGVNKVLLSTTSDGKANWSSTLTGLTNVRSTTISATTYQNLPTDIRTTGATYSNNNFIFTNNTGGTYSVSFNTVTGLTINGNLTANTVTSTGTTTSLDFFSSQSSGDEGGEIRLNKPATNSTISGVTTIDMFQNKLRFFESSGSNRGGYLDITSLSTGVGTNLQPSTVYVFNMNSFAVPNGSLFYGVYLGGTPVSPAAVATQYGGASTDYFPGYPMPAGIATTLVVILRAAQVAPTSTVTIKLANTSTSTFGPVVTIPSGSAAGTYTDNSATVSFTSNQRLSVVASNPFIAGATSSGTLSTGSFKYLLI
jgi:hypothetical protein